MPAESYILFIIFHRHLYSPAMSTVFSQVGAALFPSNTFFIIFTFPGFPFILIIILFRIVYSKMLIRGNVRTGVTGQVRRSLVIRFLAGCHENEMLNFVEMAFKKYAKYLQGIYFLIVNHRYKTNN